MHRAKCAVAAPLNTNLVGLHYQTDNLFCALSNEIHLQAQRYHTTTLQKWTHLEMPSTMSPCTKLRLQCEKHRMVSAVCPNVPIKGGPQTWRPKLSSAAYETLEIRVSRSHILHADADDDAN